MNLAQKCKHYTRRASGHCGEMTCANYSEKCRKHRLALRDDRATCTRDAK